MSKDMEKHVKTIKRFIDCYENPESVKAMLWELLNGAMESNIADSWDGAKRADMLFFYESVSELMHALFQLTPSLFFADGKP